MPVVVNDLRIGDVMLKHGIHSATHGIIAFGQALFSHNMHGGGAKTVHAALYYGAGKIIESSGGGLGIADIPKGTQWYVYRFGDQDVATLATHIAEGYCCLSESGYGAYTQAGAAFSLFGSSSLGRKTKRKAEELWSSTQHAKTFFCSNYVIRCYLAAGQTTSPATFPIKADMATSPKELQARLNMDGNWQSIGNYVQG